MLLIGLAVALLLVAVLVLAIRRADPMPSRTRSVMDLSMRLLTSPDAAAQDAAGQALDAMGTNALPTLIDLLQYRDPTASKGLWSLGSRLPRPLRVALLKNVAVPKAESIHWAAARAIGRFGPAGAPAIPALTQAMQANEAQVIWEAAATLAKIGPPAVPTLSALAQSKTLNVRLAAIRNLGAIGPAASPTVPALALALQDENPDVRTAVVEALVGVGRPALTNVIEATRSTSSAGRLAAAQALARIHPPRLLAIPAWMPLLEDPEPAVRREAVTALAGYSSSNTVVAAIVARLKDEAPVVRVAAADTVARLGAAAVAAVPNLVENLQNSNPAVQEAAARALGNIPSLPAEALSALQRLAESNSSAAPVAREVLKRLAAPADQPR